MAQAVFRIYVDDSGEKEYGSKTSRYFVYAGVVVDRAEEEAISAEIDRLKTGTFGTAQVEIKSRAPRSTAPARRRTSGPSAPGTSSPWTSSSWRAGSAADRPRAYLIAPTVNPAMKRSTKTL
jgi:hypothetical protein